MSHNKGYYDKWFDEHIEMHHRENEKKKEIFNSNIQPYLTIDGKPIYHKQKQKKSYVFFLSGMLFLLVFIIVLLFNLSPEFMDSVFSFWETLFFKLFT